LGNCVGSPTGGRPPPSPAGGINPQPFLDAADGGTGTQLNPNGGRRLNPDSF